MFDLSTYPILYTGKKVQRAVTVKFVTQKKLTQVSAVIEKFKHPYRDEEEGDKDKYDLWYKIAIFNSRGRMVETWQPGYNIPDLVACHRGLRMFEAVRRISKPLVGEISDAAMGGRPSDRLIRLLGQEQYETIMHEVPENLVPALQLLREKGVHFNKRDIENELRKGNLAYSAELHDLGFGSLDELQRQDAVAEPYMQYFRSYHIDQRRFHDVYKDAVLKLVGKIDDPALVVGVALVACEIDRMQSALDVMDIDSLLIGPIQPEERERHVASFLIKQFPGSGKSVEDYIREFDSAWNCLLKTIPEKQEPEATKD